MKPPGCVVSAIRHFKALLEAEGEKGPECEYGKSEEPCPIEFLVHFVGDVHQPLHVAYEDDEGGEEFDVTWFGKTKNLHKIWDEEIIRRYEDKTDDLVSAMHKIIEDEPDKIKEYEEVESPALWANESFTEVLNNVYDFESPALGKEYYEKNLPIVQQRLVAAAVRLAALFNDIFEEE